MDARQFFNEVRTAAKNLNNAQTRYDGLLEQYSAKTQSYDAQGAPTGGVPDSLQQRYLEAKEKLEQTNEVYAQRVAEAVELAALVTPILGANCYEYALLYYYCDAMDDWSAVAKQYPCHVSTAKHYAEVALDTIDGLGIAHLKAGKGIAE